MGSSASDFLTAPLTGAMGLFTGDLFGKPDAPPPLPGLPAPIEEIDLRSKKEYAKKKARERKGRSSTILGSQSLGLPGGGKTTVG